MIMHKILLSPLFGLVLTVVVYKISSHITKYKVLNMIPPIFMAAIFIIWLMHCYSINYKLYNNGGSLITYLLGPATIALAVPLTKNIYLLKKTWKIILTGTTMATLLGICSVYFVAEILRATHPVVLSLIPKSVTTPIAVNISKSIGGIPELTACIVIITGLFGGLLGHKLLELIKVKHNISIGLAMGAASHVMGTSRCYEENEIQAAISSLSLILVGFSTAVLAPILIKFIL